MAKIGVSGMKDGTTRSAEIRDDKPTLNGLNETYEPKCTLLRLVEQKFRGKRLESEIE